MKTWPWFALSFGAASIVAGVACSLVVDTSGLAGGPSDSGARDATPTDAAFDGFDAGADARSDGGTTTWCGQQSNLAFCDDFDSPDANLKGRWDDAWMQSGTLRVDDQNPSSPPNALLAIVVSPPSSNGNGIQKVFPPHASTRVATDLILEASDTSGYGSFVEIHLEPLLAPYQDYRAALIYTGGEMTLDTYAQGGVGGSGSIKINRTFTSWRRVQLELALTPTPHAVAYDGAGVVLATLPLPATMTRAGMGVTIGLPYLSGTSKAWQARLDNVAVTFGD